ncbi:D-alanyl-D-alanine carboxypeptidase/D-alanyl-D-alanine-endopeptidase [Mucilaginibacter sp. HMF5004]|uniref:D-alanyl-D-alanine carboxypeptidase/D-alanyl-D-alanine endopeptidase n=1 Tax=Mucilaginibacter rivuli TaxID=2857527 RepID=UPI001C5E561D|nr:D-alanyl-D-alanine carboxypeptidase/D-alanyl-D-alanine-endopeptidase [Mucilaginibacter rivuli]MBW4890602.1 D-alanyl-D-alanine carboxypeptidase/D-alanyl-D-alanine-endopeptidase [Mucilaginibacter rivuli]
MKKLLLLSFCCLAGFVNAQTLQNKLDYAFTKLQQDSQCRYSSLSLTVLDAKTGEPIFSANGDQGLATGSTMKVITSITAFNILGKDYQFTTDLNYSGTIDADGTLNGNIVIRGGGDPTLGSWRYEATKEHAILALWVDAIRKAGIKHINGRIIGDVSLFDTQAIPDGWIWQDLGTYYGAGTSALCWRENQFDIFLHAGSTQGSPVTMAKTVPAMPYLDFKTELTTGAPGTGDQSYSYLPLNGNTMYLRGTFGIDRIKTNISAAVPDPAFDAAYRLTDTLKRLGIDVTSDALSSTTASEKKMVLAPADKLLVSYYSPKLSQIIYWLNQKSVNLYAEQLLKTIAIASGRKASTNNGILAMHDFWKPRGIDSHSMNIYDGCGLSPEDRVTTSTLARILQSAHGASWYPEFYESLPLYNNMKMKSGSISSVLCYAGFHTTPSGREVCFSIMVNNYSGKSASIRQKIFDVLDVLKEH